jgi:hypothetical protein
MVGLFYIYLPMSWSIPQQIEKDIIAGKARYQTFQTGSGGQSILPVPPNSYVVIFGYDFSPAGNHVYAISLSQDTVRETIAPYGTQQISFFTGTDFFPFIHHVDIDYNFFYRPSDSELVVAANVNVETIARQLYITSTNDVSVSVGLILSNLASQNAIPITNRTPQGITYGGSGQNINTQTDFGPILTPLQFMQPSPKDYQDFAFGLLPANADGQAFATPDVTRGLIDADLYTRTNFADFANSAASKYFLNLHYALYTQTIPEQRG